MGGKRVSPDSGWVIPEYKCLGIERSRVGCLGSQPQLYSSMISFGDFLIFCAAVGVVLSYLAVVHRYLSHTD